MQKPHILSFLVILLAACTAVTGAGVDPETAEPAPGVTEPPAEVQPAEREVVVAPTEIQSVHLEDLGPAPELTNEVWLNTAGPLRLADLRGQVVLLDMWTFG